jgi:hypothetical protein
MSGRPDAFLLIDEGTATIATAVIVNVEGRWRLAGATCLPAHVGVEAAIGFLASRLASVDAAFDPGVAAIVSELPRLHARTTPPATLAVLAATARGRDRLALAARRAGWRVQAHDLASGGALSMVVALTRREVSAILVGADDPPGADERGVVSDLAAIMTGVVARRPEVIAIYAGSMGDLAPATDGATDEVATTILGPGPTDGDEDEPLTTLLDEVRAEHDDGRRAAARALASLASVLDRRILFVDVGWSAGLIARADPASPGGPVKVRSAAMTTGALVPHEIDDDVVDAVGAWLSDPPDRYRLRDRLTGLREDPHGGIPGDGAILRMAAARAAVGRLARGVPWTWRPAGPDVVLAAGGAWAAAPGSAVALALADSLRHDGVRVLGHDAARMLAPLGMIEEEARRAAIVADLADDIVVPLGSVIMPALAAGRRSHGLATVHVGGAESSLALVAGGLELIDLPPGQDAEAIVSFGDPVVLGTRGKRFAVDVAGGLGGILIDLRGVPMTLPENPDQRRLRVDAWQRAMWAGLDR